MECNSTMSLSGFNHLCSDYIHFDHTIPLAVLLLGIFVPVYSFFLGSERSSNPERDSRPLPVPEKKTTSDDRLRKGDVEVVFRSLGLLSHPQQEGEQMIRFHESDVFDLFDEKEPSEYEVRAAFEVFDENKDGFIDAKELQRILGALALSEGSGMENCRRMIRAVDENGDGKIDFNEFVKFMETICY